MRTGLSRFRALPEAEGRVLLLIAAFSGTAARPRELEGRVKLAKLDFLIRYPTYLARVLQTRQVSDEVVRGLNLEDNSSQERMIRYRYGPWDPSYYAVLGSLIGRGLVEPVPIRKGVGYRITERGRELSESLLAEGVWDSINERARLVKTHLNLSGNSLKDLLYSEVPEMAEKNWHQEVQ